jgi:hypothetical protein
MFFIKKMLQMVINCSVFKVKVICIYSTGLKWFPQVVGVIHKLLGMQFLGDQTELLWLQALAYMD